MQQTTQQPSQITVGAVCSTCTLHAADVGAFHSRYAVDNSDHGRTRVYQDWKLLLNLEK